VEARATGWWETAFGLWRWRDVERLAASEAAGGSQAVVAGASGTQAVRRTMEESGSERRAQIWAVGSRSNGQNGDREK
jgi:hypothetical protein